MSDINYVPVFDNLIKDPAVNEEFSRLAAILNGAFQNIGLTGGQNGSSPAEVGDINGNTVNTIPDDGNQSVGQGIRWRFGPWLFNADGNVKGGAVIRPVPIDANQSLYAPPDIDTAIIVEVESDAAYSITTLKVATRQHRLLLLVNRGSFTLTLVHTASTPDPGVAYPFEFPNAADFSLQAKQWVWLYQDPGSECWRPASYSQPPSTTGSNAASAFLDAGAFGTSCYNGLAYGMFGEAVPSESFSSAASRSDSIGMSRQFTTSTSIGGSGGLTGTGNLRSDQQPTWTVVLRTGSDISSLRLWSLFTNTALSNADDIGGGSQYFGFRYSTGASDPGWVGVVRDGSAQAVSGSVASIAINTVYKLKCRVTPSAIYFSVNDGAEVSLSSHLPGSSTELFWATRLYNIAAAARVWSWYRHWVKLGVSA